MQRNQPQRRKQSNKGRRAYQQRSLVSPYAHASVTPAPTPRDEIIASPLSYRGRTYKFVRNVDLGSIALSTSAITTGGFSFQLSDLPNSAEFQALFDLYRIDAVSVTFTCNYINLLGGTVAPIRYATVIDKNSSGGFTTFNDAREFDTAHVDVVTFPDTRNIIPRYIMSVGNDSAASVLGGSGRGWLNTSVANVPHYGYRYVFEAFTGAATPTVRCEAIFYLSFRAPK